MTTDLLRAVYPPPVFQGSDWHMEVGFRQSTGPNAGEPFDWTEDPTRWHLRSDLRSKNNTLLARLANFGVVDGTIAGDADGILAWDLPAAVSAELPLTRDFRNTTDPRLTTYRSRSIIFFDLLVIDTDTDEQWVLLQSQLVVAPTITAG